MQAIGRFVRERRKANGFTQTQLGAWPEPVLA